MSLGRAKDARPHRFAYDYGSVDPGMFAPPPDRSRPKRAPRRSVAYTIPLPAQSAEAGACEGHVLGVNALALSLESAGGTLFSGGRDGVVKAWDLGFPLRRGDGGALEVDRGAVRQDPPPRTRQRASQRVHSDWVNDLVVANDGQTIVSASSDQTVRAWTPERTDERPHVVGSHLDYVKTLAYSRHRCAVVSGGLDRKIKLWDITRGSATGPVYPLQDFGDVSSASSIYTLACNEQGSLVISGSPETIVRVWDVRAGRQITALAGHTDHIRAVLLSADSELVLSGSSDSTAKLWSMRMRRCLSTFSQHSDSVWALHSTHPRFHSFYSASRDGLVTKTVGAGLSADDAGPYYRRGSSSQPPRGMSEDAPGAAGVVCVAVAQEPHGVVDLVATDDTYIWTATKGTRLNRWRDVSVRAPRRAHSRGASLNSPMSQAPLTALSYIMSGDGGAADMTESDESDEVTQRSIIEAQQALHPEASLSADNRPLGAIATGHRRSRTAEHAGLASQLRPLSIASVSTNPVSPVAMAIQAEQARRSTAREPDQEDQYYDARSGTSDTSAPSASTGEGLDSISSVLVKSQQQQQPQRAPPVEPIRIPGASPAGRDVREPAQPTSDTLSIPESPLPSASLIEATSPIAAGTGSPSRPMSSQAHGGPPRLESGARDFVPEDRPVVPVRAAPDETICGRHGLHRHRALPNKRLVLAQDTGGRISLWDIMLCICLYEFPLTAAEAPRRGKYAGLYGNDFEAAVLAMTGGPREVVESWCHVDTRIGALTVHLEEAQAWNAEVHIDEVTNVTPEAISAMGDHERVNIGQWMLKRLFLNYARIRVKRGHVLPAEAALLNRWAAQIPAGKVVSARPAAAAAPGRTPPKSLSGSAAPAVSRSTTVSASSPSTGAPREAEGADTTEPQPLPPAIASELVATTAQIGLISNQKLSSESTTSMTSTKPLPPTPGPSGGASADSGTGSPVGATKKPTASTKANAGHSLGSPRHQHNPSIDTAPSSAPAQQAPTQPQPPSQAKAGDGESATSNGSAGKFMHRLRSMRVRKQKSATAASAAKPAVPIPSVPAVPAMAREAGGAPKPNSPAPPTSSRSSSAPDNDGTSAEERPELSQGRRESALVHPPRDEFSEWAGPRYATDTERTLALLQSSPAQWDHLYSPMICPRLPLPQDIIVQFFQESFEASESFPIYRNTVESIANSAPGDSSMAVFRVADDPLLSFELCMPAWLTEILLFNRQPASFQEPPKVSFILNPSPSTTLPQFPNPNARLVANRMLRARKLAIYVVDKLALPLMQQPAPNYLHAVEACMRNYQQHVQGAQSDGSAPENIYIDAFERAGEELDEAERVALADIVLWNESKRKEQDGSDSTEYVGRPELYLDLLCKETHLSAKWSLAMIKSNIWRTNSDVLVHYEWAGFVRKRIAQAQGLACQSAPEWSTVVQSSPQ
ncbi:hypothetical protein GGF46_000306 [Coemansia sp. RSA 552]|nr:hypothetical protein GGF46_000306 [Coemansia sp. RSA 552]